MKWIILLRDKTLTSFLAIGIVSLFVRRWLPNWTKLSRCMPLRQKEKGKKTKNITLSEKWRWRERGGRNKLGSKFLRWCIAYGNTPVIKKYIKKSGWNYVNTLPDICNSGAQLNKYDAVEAFRHQNDIISAQLFQSSDIKKNRVKWSLLLSYWCFIFIFYFFRLGQLFLGWCILNIQKKK